MSGTNGPAAVMSGGRHRRSFIAVVALGFGWALLPASPAAAAPGVGCSVPALSAAITAANAGPGHVVISLAPGCSYQLVTANNDANGLPVITGDVAIQARGATIARAGSAPHFRLLKVAPSGTLSLTDLTLRGGVAEDCPDDPVGGILACGGGIENFGALTIVRGILTGNVATSAADGSLSLEGGGIENFGTATITSTLFSANAADYTGTAPDTLASGGAISNENAITIDGATMLANRASTTGSNDGVVPDGGEVYGSAFVNWATGTLRSSRIVNNQASARADGVVNGAVDNLFGSLAVSHTVIAFNTSDAPGGALTGAGIGSVGSHATLSLSDSAITANRGTAPSAGIPPQCSSTAFGAIASGGGVAVISSAVDITDTSIVGNVVRSTGGCAVARGGGIFNSGTTHLVRVIVRGNVADGDTASGGGIFNRAARSITLTQSSVTDNTAGGPAASGGGIANAPTGSVTLVGSLVARNRPDNCSPAIGSCGP